MITDFEKANRSRLAAALARCKRGVKEKPSERKKANLSAARGYNSLLRMKASPAHLLDYRRQHWPERVAREEALAALGKAPEVRKKRKKG